MSFAGAVYSLSEQLIKIVKESIFIIKTGYEVERWHKHINEIILLLDTYISTEKTKNIKMENLSVLEGNLSTLKCYRKKLKNIKRRATLSKQTQRYFVW